MRYSMGITRETLDITAGIATSVSQLRILRLANAVDIYDLSLPLHFRWLAIHLHTETKDDS